MWVCIFTMLLDLCLSRTGDMFVGLVLVFGTRIIVSKLYDQLASNTENFPLNLG